MHQLVRMNRRPFDSLHQASATHWESTLFRRASTRVRSISHWDGSTSRAFSTGLCARVPAPVWMEISKAMYRWRTPRRSSTICFASS